MAKPSLALIPSGYADDKVFSVLPSNGDGDFDFTRGSTATRVNAQGLIETVTNDAPRLNYPLLDGVVQECPSLLLEPQSINVLNYSEAFDNAYWINNGVTITAKNSISPDGTQNADLLTGVSGGFGVVRFSTWSSTNKTASCFAKKGSSNLFKIANVSAGNRYVIFNLENGTVSEEATGWSGSIENFGNGWYRCTAISNNESGTFSLGVTAASESVYIWGVQLEALPYATSYIPTPDTAYSTRLAETCNGAGTSDTFNDAEGVLYAEVSALVNGGSTRVISLSGGSQSVNNIYINFNPSGGVSCQVLTSGGNYNLSTTNINQERNNKILLKYKSNDCALWVNGFEVDTDVSLSSMPIGLDRLNLDFGAGGFDFYGNVKDLRVYKTALQNSELEKLTSWTSFTDMANGQLYTIQ